MVTVVTYRNLFCCASNLYEFVIRLYYLKVFFGIRGGFICFTIAIDIAIVKAIKKDSFAKLMAIVSCPISI